MRRDDLNRERRREEKEKHEAEGQFIYIIYIERKQKNKKGQGAHVEGGTRVPEARVRNPSETATQNPPSRAKNPFCIKSK